jgi:diguanylate cyclase (GGDEF)-like protein
MSHERSVNCPAPQGSRYGFGMTQRNDQASSPPRASSDATILRDGLLWLLERRDLGAKKWRLERLMERLSRFPMPTGLIAELERTIPAEKPRGVAPASVSAGSKLAASEFATKTVELLQALASTMADAALFDSELQNSIRAFGESVPRRAIVADLRRLLADTRAIDTASRRARRREFQRRQEVSKIVGTLAKAIEESSARSDKLSSGLEDILQQLWDLPDVEGLRSLRQQVTSRVQSLAEESRSLRHDLEGARTRTSALEDIVAEQAERIMDLQTEASQDPLTGVANRRAYDHWLPKQVQVCQSTDTPFALVLLDLDHFKSINDQHGHPFGDEVLQAAAKAMVQAVRQDDIVARVGGEEFAVLIKGAVPNVARLVAERIRSSIGRLEIRPDADADAVPVTASAGLASLRPDDDPESLYGRADRCLYRAKNSGRDRLVDDWLDDDAIDH